MIILVVLKYCVIYLILYIPVKNNKNNLFFDFTNRMRVFKWIIIGILINLNLTLIQYLKIRLNLAFIIDWSLALIIKWCI